MQTNLVPLTYENAQDFAPVLNSLAQFREVGDSKKERLALSLHSSGFSVQLTTKQRLFQRICSFFYKPRHLRLGFILEKTIDILEKNEKLFSDRESLEKLQQFQMRLFSVKKVRSKASKSLIRLEKLIETTKKVLKQNCENIQKIQDDLETCQKQENEKQKEIETNGLQKKKWYKNEIDKIRKTKPEKIKNNCNEEFVRRVSNRIISFQNDASVFRYKDFSDFILAAESSCDLTFKNSITKRVFRTHSVFFRDFLKGKKGKSFNLKCKEWHIDFLLQILHGKLEQNRLIEFSSIPIIFDLAYLLQQPELINLFLNTLRDYFSKDPYSVIDILFHILEPKHDMPDPKLPLVPLSIAELTMTFHDKINFSELSYPKEKYDIVFNGLLNALEFYEKYVQDNPAHFSVTVYEDMQKFVQQMESMNVL